MPEEKAKQAATVDAAPKPTAEPRKPEVRPAAIADAAPKPAEAEQREPIDVPELVFSTYLQDLEAAGAAPELVARLRKVLLADKTYTERAINDALFPPSLDL